MEQGYGDQPVAQERRLFDLETRVAQVEAKNLKLVAALAELAEKVSPKEKSALESVVTGG